MDPNARGLDQLAGFVRAAVVSVDFGIAHGTGFALSSTHIVTCAHVLATTPSELPETVKITTSDGRTFWASPLVDTFRHERSGLDFIVLAAADGQGGPLRRVWTDGSLEVNDDLWAYGRPTGEFEGGQPATFTYEGPSRRRNADVDLPRVKGTRVGLGFSGSPVLNIRSGAVCGILSTARHSSAHLVPIDAIRAVLDVPTTPPRYWTVGLSDSQRLRAGLPTGDIEAYLRSTAQASERLKLSLHDAAYGPVATSQVYVTPELSCDNLPVHTWTFTYEASTTFLVAGAGIGKSRLLMQIEQSLLQQCDAGDWRLLPVLVSADDLAGIGSTEEILASSVRRRLGPHGFGSVDPRLFARRPLLAGKWLILVDGLDEVIDLGRREEVLIRLSALTADPADRFSAVVTSRPLRLDDRHLDGWQPTIITLHAFTSSQQVEFCTEWLVLNGFSRANALDTAERLVALLRERDVVELASSPLLLTMICAVAFARRDVDVSVRLDLQVEDLPSSRVDIYGRYVDMLLYRRFSISPNSLYSRVRDSFERYGSAAQSAAEKLLDNQAELLQRLASTALSNPDLDILALVDEWIERVRPTHVPAAEWSRLVLEILRHSGVVSVDSHAGAEFFHPTLREFLAARHVAASARALEPSAAQGELEHAAGRDSSYFRFLAGLWDRPEDVRVVLLKALDAEPLRACKLVAQLSVDRFDVGAAVRATTLSRLQGIATGHRTSDVERAAAVVASVRTDRFAGRDLAVRMVESSKLHGDIRLWAAFALSELYSHSNLVRSSVITHVAELTDEQLAEAMLVLAAVPGSAGADLLVTIATSDSIETTPRKLAVDALDAVDDPRVQSLRLRSQLGVSASRATSVRVKARLARLGGQRSSSNPVLEPLLQTVRENHPKSDLREIERAYVVAERYYRAQRRKSGDPYILHPLAVATILADLGMTAPTLCAALLHDTVEDTAYTIDALSKDFGPEVAALVDGVTKLDRVVYGQATQAETVRKMVVAMARDIRVLVIKLADRLHNMRTLKYVSATSAERTSRETLEIYAPLAHRLGMNTLKGELEDLAFQALYPNRYDEIVELVAERHPRRRGCLDEVIEQVQEDLRAAKIKATVSGRLKHYYSIYQKMIVRGREFDDIYDLVGVRVLVDSLRDCYAVVGAIHARWNPIAGRFKDYIAMPNFNRYQSLHTSVVGPGGWPVELQIRTHDMHRRAEYGIAAEWRHSKTAVLANQPSARGSASSPEMAWLRQIVDWQKETSDPTEFLDSLRDLSTAEVYVFTPRGDVIPLPSGSTPVDFAYAVHTEVGHTCVGARVNGRLVPLESALTTGDVVEVFTSKAPGAGPSRDWQQFVQSAKARRSIRQWFSKERREEAIERGKEALARQMRKEGLPIHLLLAADNLALVALDLSRPDVAGLYAAIGEAEISAATVIEKLVQGLGGLDALSAAEPREEADGAEAERAMPGTRTRLASADVGIIVRGVNNVWVKLSRCCTPVPGDQILGFVTRGHGVSVHRTDCVNAAALANQRDRLVEVEWAPTARSMFLVAIQVEALDRARLLSDVTRVLSDQHVNILSATVITSQDRVARSRFMFEMSNADQLGPVLKAVRSIPGVYEVARVTSDQT